MSQMVLLFLCITVRVLVISGSQSRILKRQAEDAPEGPPPGLTSVGVGGPPPGIGGSADSNCLKPTTIAALDLDRVRQ